MDFDNDNFENTAPDWDPEGEAEFALDTEEGRTHYVAVGNSALRKNFPIELDAKYSGKKVSRTEMEDNETDEDSEMAFEEWASESDGTSGSFDGHSDVSGELEVESEENESSVEEHVEEEAGNLHSLMLKKMQQHEKEENESRKQVDEAAQKELEQGAYVRKQLGLWEGLLEIRIKMQKVVDSANVLPQYDYYVEYFEKSRDEELEKELEETSRDLCGVIDELVEIRKVNDTYADSSYKRTDGNSFRWHKKKKRG
jgi:protein AATF/BFR2